MTEHVVAQPATRDVVVAPLRVLIADDHPLMLARIRRALERDEDLEVVGEACSGGQLMELIELLRPSMVLMDLRMPGVSGLGCIKRIRDGWPEVKIVVLSASEDRESIDSALEAGASAYIVKSTSAIDIAATLHQTSGGGNSRPSAPFSEGERRRAESPEGLTEREQTVLAAVASGMTTAAISADLWMSEQTVKFHLTNICRKLGVSNRAGAIRFALEHGIGA